MWECKVCYSQMEDEMDACKSCGAKKGTRADRPAPGATIQTEPEDKRLGMAIFFGLVAAILAAFTWYGVVIVTNYELGILAIGVGLLVAQAVIFGAGGRRGGDLQIISVVCIILAMALAQYMIVRHFLNKELVKQGYQNLPLLLPVKAVLEFLWLSIKESPLTLVFWAIAVYEGFTIPSKKPQIAQPGKDTTGDTGAVEETPLQEEPGSAVPDQVDR